MAGRFSDNRSYEISQRPNWTTGDIQLGERDFGAESVITWECFKACLELTKTLHSAWNCQECLVCFSITREAHHYLAHRDKTTPKFITGLICGKLVYSAMYTPAHLPGWSKQNRSFSPTMAWLFPTGYDRDTRTLLPSWMNFVVGTERVFFWRALNWYIFDDIGVPIVMKCWMRYSKLQAR